MARFYTWSPRDVDDLSGSDLLEWTDAANAMIARQQEAARRKNRVR